MFPYKATQYDTFMALVQASNPGLDIAPLTADQLRTLVPTVITADSFGRDTTVRLMVRPGNSKYFGSKVVTYRRLNLANFFRNTNAMIDTFNNGVTVFTAAQLATAFNAKYGTALVTADFATAGNILTAGTRTNLTINGLCYEGTLNVLWSPSKQFITDKIPQSSVLTGRVYPGGNTFPQAKPPADFYTYNLDCTSLKTAIAALAASGTAFDATTGNGATILSFLQRARPDLNLTSAQSTTQGGLSGMPWARYTLPSANAPAANSAKYTAVLVLTAAAGSWFTGTFYLHYTA